MITLQYIGKWLWRSWQSGCLRYQRTRVRIQSSATFIEHLFTVCRKDENKEKRPGMAHLFKKKNKKKNITVCPAKARFKTNEGESADFFLQ